MRAWELAELLQKAEGNPEVYLYDEYGDITEVTSSEVTDYKEAIVCECNHSVTRHSFTIQARVDRLFGGAFDSGPCADCSCQKFKNKERKIVVLT